MTTGSATSIPLNLDNFRKRHWSPAVEAAGVRIPATPYDMRDTFGSNALAARVTVFELAKIMGTSVRMIERHYGALLDGRTRGLPNDSIRSKLSSRKPRESEVWREGARLGEYFAMTPELFGPTRHHKFLSLVDPELVEAPPWRS